MTIQSIESITPLAATEDLRSTQPTLAPAGAPSFESVLTDAVGQASAMDQAANEKSQALASGAIDDLHGTMISLKEADISIKLVGTVRNKILDAFQELWRTSV
jgi:flagellar hook-basal body complex protein FliE